MSALTSNKSVLSWIDEKVELVKPDKIVWIDGSKEQIEELRATACSTGELIKLNQELLPDCYLHRTAVNDVARVEGRTFICATTKEEAGPTNNWMDPAEAYTMLYDIARDSYKGRTMYVIPYSMGPVGSPFAKVGIELTDSIYVVLNMVIMTRVGKDVLEVLGDSNDWVRGLHCRCDIDEEKRYICQFPQDNTIISVNSGYGGNVLLGKKCFALRIASYQGWKEGWQAEHMLILGIENPQGEVKYICAAFPSACGKTNLAMLIPTEDFTLLTPKTVSSALLPALTKNLTPTLLQQQNRAQFSQTLHTTLTTTLYGGKVSTRILLQTLLNGRAIPGTVRKVMKKVLIPTAVSLLPQLTAPVSALNSRIPMVFRFLLLYSAADVQNLLPLFISHVTGITVYSLVQLWLLKQLQPLPVQ